MEQQIQLARPFPERREKDNPTGFGTYVPHWAYVERLSATGPYDFEIEQLIRGTVETKGGQLENVVVGALCRLTMEVDGVRRTVVEVGDCERPQNWPHDGARAKDAVSDAFKRCCMRGFALGLHLYSGRDEYNLHDYLVEKNK